MVVIGEAYLYRRQLEDGNDKNKTKKAVCTQDFSMCVFLHNEFVVFSYDYQTVVYINCLVCCKINVLLKYLSSVFEAKSFHRNITL